jgi:hypothetical protein
MKEPRWVPRLVVESAHLDQIRTHGGLPALRDAHALEAALATGSLAEPALATWFRERLVRLKLRQAPVSDRR